MSSKEVPPPPEDYRLKLAVQFMLKYETRARATPAPTADMDIPGA